VRIVTDTTHSTFVTAVSGRLDNTAAAEFERQVQEIMANGPESLIFDFTGLSYISSTGLRIVLEVGRVLRERGGDLSITGLNDVVLEIFELSGLLTVFKRIDSVEDAASRP